MKELEYAMQMEAKWRRHLNKQDGRSDCETPPFGYKEMVEVVQAYTRLHDVLLAFSRSGVDGPKD